MLLNVGPKADGTITEEERSVLLSVGEWLKRNGEGIYGTTYWQKYGEGPTKITGGYFQDSDPCLIHQRILGLPLRRVICMPLL